MFEFFNVKFKEVLDIPTLLIEKEKVTTLVGASGSGKTSILRMLNKMLSPTQGKILFKGLDLRGIDSVTHRRNVIMLSQNPAIFQGNIRDNLNIGMKFQERECLGDEALNQMLERVKLNKSLDNLAGTLSGGEKQRLALGRVLLLDPEIFLLDEPSSALDNETEDILIKMIVEYVRIEKKTMIMVTHSKNIADKYSDIIIDIVQGKNMQRRMVNERSY